jgi:cyclophilin family peptidyl-prolyl cis-trans isomerase
MLRNSLLSLLAAFILFSCQKKESQNITQDNLVSVLTEYEKANPETKVVIETAYGTMRLKLYQETPLHRANFVKAIKEGAYEDGEFYRIIYQFMIQGGRYPNDYTYTLPAEFNKKYFHKTGALSMARSDENNPDKRSSGSEFFIVHGSKYADYQVKQEEENNHLSLTSEQREAYTSVGGYMSLDQEYTVFGEVTEGLEVIEKIAGVKVFQEDKPLKKIPFKIRVE